MDSGWVGVDTLEKANIENLSKKNILGRYFPAVQYKIHISDKKFVPIMVVYYYYGCVCGWVFLFVSG